MRRATQRGRAMRPSASASASVRPGLRLHRPLLAPFAPQFTGGTGEPGPYRCKSSTGTSGAKAPIPNGALGVTPGIAPLHRPRRKGQFLEAELRVQTVSIFACQGRSASITFRDLWRPLTVHRPDF